MDKINKLKYNESANGIKYNHYSVSGVANYTSHASTMPNTMFEIVKNRRVSEGKSIMKYHNK